MKDWRSLPLRGRKGPQEPPRAPFWPTTAAGLVSPTIKARKQLNPSGEVFRAWFECSICLGKVHLGDRFCRHCGVEFWKGGGDHARG